jgi:hypothetical protein
LVLGLAVGDFVNAVEGKEGINSVRWGHGYQEEKATHRNHSFVARTRPGR